MKHCLQFSSDFLLEFLSLFPKPKDDQIILDHFQLVNNNLEPSQSTPIAFFFLSFLFPFGQIHKTTQVFQELCKTPKIIQFFLILQSQPKSTHKSLGVFGLPTLSCSLSNQFSKHETHLPLSFSLFLGLFFIQSIFNRPRPL